MYLCMNVINVIINNVSQEFLIHQNGINQICVECME